MHAPTVDITKVQLTPKSLIWLFVALVAVIALYKGAGATVAYLSARAPGAAMITQRSGPAALMGA